MSGYTHLPMDSDGPSLVRICKHNMSIDMTDYWHDVRYLVPKGAYRLQLLQ